MMKALNNNKFIKIQEKLNMMKIKSKNCVKNIYLRWSFYAIIVNVLAVNYILKKKPPSQIITRNMILPSAFYHIQFFEKLFFPASYLADQ